MVCFEISSLQSIQNYKHKRLIFDALKTRVNCEHRVENISKNDNIFKVSLLLNNCGKISRKIFIINIVDSEVATGNSYGKSSSTYSADPPTLTAPTITKADVITNILVTTVSITGTNFYKSDGTSKKVNTYAFINALKFDDSNFRQIPTNISVKIPSVYGFMTVNAVNNNTDKMLISNQVIVQRDPPKDSPTVTSIDNSTIDSSTSFKLGLIGTNLTKIKTVILAMVLNNITHTADIILTSLTFDPVTGIATFEPYSSTLLKPSGSLGPFNVVLNTDTNIQIGIDPAIASVTLTTPPTPVPDPTPPTPVPDPTPPTPVPDPTPPTPVPDPTPPTPASYQNFNRGSVYKY
jgi:hypothetical protein